jgi:uncharacterized membrane protein (UPF0127 family)
MKTVNILNGTHPLPSPLRAGYCDSFLGRLRGLMFRSNLAKDEGFLFVEVHDTWIDTSIHMLFVYMDLAVIWINSAHEVVDVVLARSWRPAYAPHRPAQYTLEIHPDRLNEFVIGDKIEF